MKVAHIIPPGWAGIYPKGAYRMVLAHWALEYPKYAATVKGASRALAVDSPFILLDNGAFEGRELSNAQLNEAARRVVADEVVLPDVKGDGAATLRRSWSALGKLATTRVVFVPQGKDVEEWSKCLRAWLRRWEGSEWSKTYTLTIGITSLRDPETKEQVKGVRAALMLEASKTAYPLHLLGIGDPYLFASEDLPMALKCAVRGVDTSTAFAQAAAGKMLTTDRQKEFLREPSAYDLLDTSQRRLVWLNIEILDAWVASGEGNEYVSTWLIRNVAHKWLKYYAEGYCPLHDAMEAVGLRGRFALTRGARLGRTKTRREKHIREVERDEDLPEWEEEINV